jgi:F-type H+-transporting ATPase subunit gamma
MTRRRDIERQRHSLTEIRGIMNAMKTLAYLENRKLSGVLHAQEAMIGSIETAVADFLRFYPQLIPRQTEGNTAYIVVGSERGFCGDFNRKIDETLADVLRHHAKTSPQLIAVGQKLHPLILNHNHAAMLLDGAGVLEEIPQRLEQLAILLDQLYRPRGPDRLFCLFHASEGAIEMRELLPPFLQLATEAKPSTIKPLLNLQPGDLLAGLTEHHLFALLHWILYASLLAENRQRLSHLNGAIRHLDNRNLRLTHRYNALRQEEIIEEIEVILLSYSNECFTRSFEKETNSRLVQ